MRFSATSAAEAVQPGVTDSNPVLTGTAHEEPLLSSHPRIQVKRFAETFCLPQAWHVV